MPAPKARQPTLRGYLNCGQDEANMLDRMRVARRLSTVLLAVMLTQALMGLAFQAAYRDVEWIRATWFGNDWVTLVVAAPLLLIGLRPHRCRICTRIAVVARPDRVRAL